MVENKNPHRAGWGKTNGTGSPFVISNSTPIYVGSKVVGKVRGSTFYKTVYASKHFLKYPPAIAFDIKSLVAAEKAGAKRVVIKDKDTGTVYYAPIQYIREWGFEIDRGHGRQIALLIAEWKCK